MATDLGKMLLSLGNTFVQCRKPGGGCAMFCLAPGLIVKN
jgi:hypothetical protein